jgi:acetate kinase
VRVLVVNAGSSSLKLRLLGPDDAVIGHRDLAASPPEPELTSAVRELGGPDAVGHRIVHGGRRYLGPVRIDAAVEAGLRELVDLAPLHQPKSLAALDAVSRVLPDTPAVACFDTAFHAEMPAAAATYALPASWRERWGLRRYGFHGLSHGYAARRAAAMLAVPGSELRVVTCHLGAGASLAAVEGGRSVDTSMGFTPLEGLVMATRSGSVDPGLLLWLLERADMDEREMAHALEHESGLAGLAGEGDMRAVLAAAGEGDDRSQLALDVYLHRLRAGIAAMAAAMGGLEALVFTGGVGERAPAIRAAAAEGLAFLGVEVAPDANRCAVGDAEISAAGAPVRTLVITSREDLEIAHETRDALSGDRPGSRET